MLRRWGKGSDDSVLGKQWPVHRLAWALQEQLLEENLKKIFTVKEKYRTEPSTCARQPVLFLALNWVSNFLKYIPPWLWATGWQHKLMVPFTPKRQRHNFPGEAFLCGVHVHPPCSQARVLDEGCRLNWCSGKDVGSAQQVLHKTLKNILDSGSTSRSNQ